MADRVNGRRGGQRTEVVSAKVSRGELAQIEAAAAQTLLPRSDVVRIGALMYAQRILEGHDGGMALEAVPQDGGLLVRPVSVK